MIVHWSKEHQTGHPVIDHDHQDIVAILNRLEVLADGEPRQEIGQLLCDITDCVLVHFGHEEMLMQRVRYPAYDDHMLSHCRFFATLTRFIFDFETGETGLVRDIQEFLARWLVEHESSEDQAFVAFLKLHHPDIADGR